ncbi:hypothetical protein GF312_04770 [Candidatus Poribacteria bacterium]|nr:hypothetical protein [Candidatus Poribacteria bacterium]
MFFTHLLFAIILGFLFTLVFAVGFRRRGPWGNIFIFFVLVFLVTWAGGLWIAPFGPVYWGVAWLPFLIIGFLFAMLLAASGPVQPVKSPEEAIEEAKIEVAVQSILNIFLWVFILGLVFAIVYSYITA